MNIHRTLKAFLISMVIMLLTCMVIFNVGTVEISTALAVPEWTVRVIPNLMILLMLVLLILAAVAVWSRKWF